MNGGGLDTLKMILLYFGWICILYIIIIGIILYISSKSLASDIDDLELMEIPPSTSDGEGN